jgi:hypothetical protein
VRTPWFACLVLLACNAGDQNATTGTSLVCAQRDTSGFAPLVQGKPTATPGACSPDELQSFVAACFGSTATTEACAGWQKLDAGNCATCLAPVLANSPTWGPFYCMSIETPCGTNAGGCVDLVMGAIASEKGQGGAGTCGDSLTNAFACEDYVCNACNTTFGACLDAAAPAECASYMTASASCSALAPCLPSSDADNVAFVNVFCGAGP